MARINISINYNADSLAKFGDKLEIAVAKIARKAAEKAQSYWMTEAGKRLHTTSWKYIEAIQISEGTGGKTSIYLQHSDAKINSFLLRLEQGMGGNQIDMKPELLKGAAWRIIPLWKESGAKPIEFRTVSINSPVDSWLWPKDPNGTVGKGVHLMDNVYNELSNGLLDKVIEEVLRDEGL